MSIKLPRNCCPRCGKLLFIGFAENIEIKCRRCKELCKFTKDDWNNKKIETPEAQCIGGKT